MSIQERLPARTKRRLHLRFDRALSDKLDSFADGHGLERTWVIEQSVRLLIELVDARESGQRIVRIKKSGKVFELQHLYAIPLLSSRGRRSPNVMETDQPAGPKNLAGTPRCATRKS